MRKLFIMRRFIYSALLVLLTFTSVAAPVSAATTPSKLAPCTAKNQKHPKNTYKTEVIAFKTVTQSDSSLPKGQTQQAQSGINGKRLITYTASYNKKGKLVVCKHTGTKVTLAPVNAITRVGTYVAPDPTPTPTPVSSSPTNCTNGTYVNSAGNTVCSPEPDTGGGAPAGATAQCRDGSYSFSQSRSGTCSHHGGVATWL